MIVCSIVSLKDRSCIRIEWLRRGRHTTRSCVYEAQEIQMLEIHYYCGRMPATNKLRFAQQYIILLYNKSKQKMNFNTPGQSLGLNINSIDRKSSRQSFWRRIEKRVRHRRHNRCTLIHLLFFSHRRFNKKFLTSKFSLYQVLEPR